MRNCIALLIAIIASHSITACTSKEEQENLQRTNDGTETLKPVEKSEMPTGASQKPTEEAHSDGTETLKPVEKSDVPNGLPRPPSKPGDSERNGR